MNVSLTPELEAYVAKKVESGLYQTASEVIREGLRLLRERDDLRQLTLDELRREIAVGIAEAEQGKVAPLDARATLSRVRQQQSAQAGKKR
jgi:antitoxin ParD1/3/4